MEKDDDMLAAVRANMIKEFEENRKGKPTREDMGKLLEDKEGQVFYFKITYNHSSRKMDPDEYKAIEDHLHDKYRLYKLKSTIDSTGNTKKQTLSRSTYMAFIDHEQGTGGTTSTVKSIIVQLLVSHISP